MHHSNYMEGQNRKFYQFQERSPRYNPLLSARERLRHADPESLDDFELLSLVVNNQDVARTLLKKFGSINMVVNASVDRLEAVQDLSEEMIGNILLAKALVERSARREVANREVLTSWTQLVDYCRTKMAFRDTEMFHVLYLDNKNKLIADEVQGEGTVNHVPVQPRKVAENALKHNASAVILVHNHPSGDLKPSRGDIVTTQDIQDGLKTLGIRLHDHIIVTSKGETSFRDGEYL